MFFFAFASRFYTNFRAVAGSFVSCFCDLGKRNFVCFMTFSGTCGFASQLEKRASFWGNQKASDHETKRGKSNLIHLIHVIVDTSRNVSKDDLLFSLKLPNV